VASSASASLVSAAPTISEQVTLSVVDYLQSYDVVRLLRKSFNISEIYNRPRLDVLARLGSNDSDERVKKYLFKNFSMVDAYVDINSGLGVIKVRAFSPEDARAVADRMLEGADQLVQQFSQRAERDALSVAQDAVVKAEAALVEQKQEMARFRANKAIIDPERTSTSMSDLVTGLEQQLAQAKVDLQAASRYLDGNSPKVHQLQEQIASLNGQIDIQRQSMTRPQDSLANTLSGYEQLQVRAQFAEANLTSALTSLQTARLEAAKHHLFLIQVVQPNLPQESEFPRRIIMVLTVFVVLNTFFGIGWLIFTGIKEHAA
jgi:capsular polysaccharide transport system permease protein